MNRTKFWPLLPLSFYHSVSDVTEPEPSGGNPGGGSLYTFGEADGGKLGLGKNVTSEADVPTRVDIPDELVSGNFFHLIRLPIGNIHMQVYLYYKGRCLSVLTQMFKP